MNGIVRNVVLSLVIIVLRTDSTLSQWVPTSGPYGGTVSWLLVNGSTVFAAAGPAGVFRSTNNGTSWTGANMGLASSAVSALAASGTDLFAGTDRGVFLSTDEGTSWTAIDP